MEDIGLREAPIQREQLERLRHCMSTGMKLDYNYNYIQYCMYIFQFHRNDEMVIGW